MLVVFVLLEIEILFSFVYVRDFNVGHFRSVRDWNKAEVSDSQKVNKENMISDITGENADVQVQAWVHRINLDNSWFVRVQYLVSRYDRLSEK